MRASWRRLLGLVPALALTLAVGAAPVRARAEGKASAGQKSEAKAKAGKKPDAKDRRLAAITPKGRPKVELDRLDFPTDVPNAKRYKKFLRKRLEREARRAKWGAGRNNLIQYRFSIKELSITTDGEVLRVRCSAVGRLPGGQAAKSQLSFGGDPKKRNAVVENVLAIVARGVVSRLAELERIRRGDLRRSGVRPPTTTD